MSQVDFAGAVSSARIALEQNPRGELSLPLRRVIWDAMGPYDREADVPVGPGYRRRSRLDLLTAEHALSLWPDGPSDDRELKRVLELAARVVDDRTFVGRLRRQQEDLLSQGDVFLAQGQFAAGYVHHAAAAAVSTVLVDHDITALPIATVDEQLDPDIWDASYYAALAAKERDTGREQPRAFWSWYLEAAERAYDNRPQMDQLALTSTQTEVSPERDLAALATEEDIRSRVLVPWLRALGLAPEDLEYDTQLHLRIGNRVGVTIGEQREEHKRAYPDIVYYINGRPLFVVEVKRANDPLGAEAREQAISYARLLEQIAPFAVVANNTSAHLYDVVTGAEIHSVLDSEYYRNSGVISITAESRARAKRTLAESLAAA